MWHVMAGGEWPTCVENHDDQEEPKRFVTDLLNNIEAEVIKRKSDARGMGDLRAAISAFRPAVKRFSGSRLREVKRHSDIRYLVTLTRYLPRNQTFRI
jgi:hypothetical protein